MKGNTEQGFVFKSSVPRMNQIESVPSGGSVIGITGSKCDTKKSSNSAGFSTSSKSGSINGQTKTNA